MPDQDAFEAALEEAIALFEQGENMNQARFDELIAELEARRPALHAVPEDDPRAERARALERRAAELEVELEAAVNAGTRAASPREAEAALPAELEG